MELNRKFSQFVVNLMLVLLCVVSLPGSLGMPAFAHEVVKTQELKDLKIAIGAYEDGLYKIASTYFTGFLKKYPASPYKLKAYFLLGNCLTKSGQSQKALKVYETALHGIQGLKPAAIVKLNYLICRIYIRKKNRPQAIKHLQAIVHLSSAKKIKTDTVFRAFMMLSKIYFVASKFAQSEAILSKLLTMNPPSPWKEKALIQKGGLLIKQKKYKETVKILRPYMERADFSKSNYANEISQLWAISNLASGKYCKAQKSYEKLLKKAADTLAFDTIIKGYVVSSYRCYADEHVRDVMFQTLLKKFKERPSILFQIYAVEGLLYFQDKKFEKSKAILIKALERFSDHPQVPHLLLKLDQVFEESKNYNQWEALLKKFDKNKKCVPETQVICDYLLGNLYFSKKEYKTALPFYFNVINHKKYRASSLEKIVFCYYYLEKFKEAKTNLDIFLLENPQAAEKPHILFLNGDLYLREKQTENALKTFRKIIDPPKINKAKLKSPWVQKAILETGMIFFQRKDVKKAKRYFLRVLRCTTIEFENEKQAVFYLGLIADQEQKTDLSESYFLISSTSKNPKIRIESIFRLGLLYFSMGSFEEATHQFETILRDFPHRIKWCNLARLQLAGIAIKLKNPEKADVYLKKIIESAEDKEIKGKAYQLHLKLHDSKKKT